MKPVSDWSLSMAFEIASAAVAVTTIILVDCVYPPNCRSLTESAYRIG